MKLLFAGTPDFAVPALRSLAAEAQIVAVLTNPDRPTGRRGTPTPSAVKQAAVQLGLRVLVPDSLVEIHADILDLAPQLMVVAAFGRIFLPAFLDLFPRGAINIHPSLLPRHRGPTPIPACILTGDAVTGVTIQHVAVEVDAGDVYHQQRVTLDGSETTATLTARLAELGAPMAVRTVREIRAVTADPRPQDHQLATYCHLLQKQDGLIDWTFPAAKIARQIRAYDPWPTAFTALDGVRIALLAVQPVDAAANGAGSPGTIAGIDPERGILLQTGDGMLAVTRLHPQGKRPMDFKAFANGRPRLVGRVLG